MVAEVVINQVVPGGQGREDRAQPGDVIVSTTALRSSTSSS